ncbi:hypothetical protein [Haloprofundus sp. MHR1]|nr:hypothetical protein [Haloprofundus sp. MHR1]
MSADRTSVSPEDIESPSFDRGVPKLPNAPDGAEEPGEAGDVEGGEPL